MVMRFLCGLLLLVISQVSLAVDGVTASVDKNPVLVGEYFTLTIEATGKVSGETPDTSELARLFSIGPMSTSSRTSIINGSISSSTSWQMQVLARRAGEFTIPAFTVAGATSDPITLKVIERDNNATEQNDVFVKMTLQDGPLYVQQAALVSVKLYVGKELLDGQLTAPEMPDTQFTLLGKQKEEYEIVDGRRYYVVTREYLMQPNRSGEFTISAPIFNGQVRDGYRRMAINAMADNITVDVQPIPTQFPGAWLPSDLVHLGEEWKPTDSTVTVGTPITRTLTLTATGVTQEQLPELEVAQVDGFRAYPDDSERKQITRDGRIISQLVTSIALLPQKPGTYTLPEIQVPWFNTRMAKVEYASVPARTVTVIADPNAPAVPVSTPQSAVVEQPSGLNLPTQAEVVAALPATKSFLDWAILASGYGLWIITLLWVWLSRSRKPSAPTEQTATASDATITVAMLEPLVKQKQASHYLQTLIKLVQQQYGCSLQDWLKKAEDPVLEREIANLQASLYSAKQQHVDLTILHRHVRDVLKKQNKKQDDTKKKLTALY